MPTLSHCVLQVDAFRATLENDEQKLGADIIRKALAYPIRLIASNAGVNGSVVMNKVWGEGGGGAGLGKRQAGGKAGQRASAGGAGGINAGSWEGRKGEGACCYVLSRESPVQIV